MGFFFCCSTHINTLIHTHKQRAVLPVKQRVIGFYFLPLSGVPMNHKRQSQGYKSPQSFSEGLGLLGKRLCGNAPSSVYHADPHLFDPSASSSSYSLIMLI